MALHKRLYDCYKLVTKSRLVSGDVSEDTIAEFQTLLNNAQPVDDVEELARRSLVKSMYYSNQEGFMRYISSSANRVSALILWTESKRIVRFFNLQGKVHLSWNDETNQYVAQKHLKQSDRSTTSKPKHRDSHAKMSKSRLQREQTSGHYGSQTSGHYGSQSNGQSTSQSTGQSWADIVDSQEKLSTKNRQNQQETQSTQQSTQQDTQDSHNNQPTNTTQASA